ncbi:MAG: biotin/lipoyl-containing protein [Thermodesulfobacteriota bacterium]
MRRYSITIGDKAFEVEIRSLTGDHARVLVNGRPYEVKFQSLGGMPRAAAPPAAVAPLREPTPPPSTPPPAAKPTPLPPLKEEAPAVGLGVITAPMPGIILDVRVKVGDQVKAGDTVVKLEAMKMENDVRSTVSGMISEVRVSKGANVTVGEILVVVTEG